MLALLSALVPLAHAACEPDVPAVTDLLPADGSVDVPQSASVGAFISGDPAAYKVTLTDASGEEVPSRRSLRTWDGADLAEGGKALVLLTPDLELIEGETYTVNATPQDKDGEPEQTASFVVGPSVDITPTPPRLDLLAVDDELGLDECDHPSARRFQAELTGLDDVWAGSGFVSVFATGTGGGLDRLVGVYPAPADGEILSFDAVMPIDGRPGGDCLTVVAEGEARKGSLPFFVCPPEALEGPAGAFSGGAGCNVAAAPATGLIGVLSGLAALFGRRREQD